jgi:type IV secretion system protein VirD4
MFKTIATAEKMYASIIGIVAEKLDIMSFDGIDKFFHNPQKISFKDLGREKTIVFLNISDSDRTMDRLISIFYTQALQELMLSADKDYENHRLKIPARLILDDFATNFCIPDFDKLISVIRSREIYVSVILQSISQLYGLYGEHDAQTIINNCDNCLYLGGQDVHTAEYIATKVNKTPNTILNMPLGEAWLFTRGGGVKQVAKFDITKHKEYKNLPEARETDKTAEEALEI